MKCCRCPREMALPLFFEVHTTHGAGDDYDDEWAPICHLCVIQAVAAFTSYPAFASIGIVQWNAEIVLQDDYRFIRTRVPPKIRDQVYYATSPP